MQGKTNGLNNKRNRLNHPVGLLTSWKDFSNVNGSFECYEELPLIVCGIMLTLSTLISLMKTMLSN